MFVIEVVGTGLKAESDNGHFVITGVPASEEGYTLKITGLPCKRNKRCCG